MNIFVTNPDPVVSAKALPDKHVVKMPLETCKMLSTVKEKEAVKIILSETIHESVIEWLMEKDHLRRLPFLGPNVENVG